jgi:hypothetical protein
VPSRVALATSGLRTLLLSTDPASNLDDIFGITPSSEPTAVTDVPNLDVADRGHLVTLSTTDPAAHLTHALAEKTHTGVPRS